MSPTIFESILLLFFMWFHVSTSDLPIVSTTYGSIMGNILTTDTGIEYYAFQEVPFASPPIGNLRFKEPVPPKKWDETLNTTENTKICHQMDSRSNNLRETEDCLYLNVYTPKQPGDNSMEDLQVLVWIHGGNFVNGDATFQSFGPQYFMSYNVVVVSINYRLGPFGFLTTEDGVIPGNLGLKDQHFALQWVQSNINFFGGDPSKVTIVGEDAGATSVGYHILNKNSEGLFRAAILQSGTALASFAHQSWAKSYALEFANALGLEPSNNSIELLEFLQTVPEESFKNVSLDVTKERENGIGSHRKLIWTPVIEDENLNNTFITGLMHENTKNGDVNKVPIMIGFNSEEELMFINYDILKESKRYDDSLELLINNKFDMSEEDKKNAAAEFRKIYANGTFTKDYGSIIKYLSDEAFSTPAIRQAHLHCGYSDVYLYEFCHKGVLGAVNISVQGTETVTHTEELHYLWDLPDNPRKDRLPVTDTLTRNRLLKLWTNFIKYLNPTPESDPLLDFITWPKVMMTIEHKFDYLNINTTLEVKADPKHYKEFSRIIDKYVKGPLSSY